tara:strand:- start:2404 stop:3087 length:684 start_codon:yes stop_codon:yes gene_type:complete
MTATNLLKPMIFRFILLPLATLALAAPLSFGQESESPDLASKVLTAAGGKDKLFTQYRLTELLKVTRDQEKLFQPFDENRRPRISYIRAPHLWWLNKKGEWTERGKEPAKWLAYGWTLAVLNDPEAKIQPLADLVDPETKMEMVGLRVTGPVEPAMDLYFDHKTMLLVRMDWDDEICRFSKPEQFDGFRLPTRCVGYRRKSGEPWYVSEIKNVERLTKIPEEVDTSE